MTEQKALVARRVRVLPRTQYVMPLRGDDANWQIWRDVNRNVLLARFASARGKGYVSPSPVTPVKLTAQGDYAMVVKVLRDPPSRTPWYVSAVVASLSATIGIGVAAYHARYVLLGIAAGIVALPVVWWIFTNLGHYVGACPGMHCKGCGR
jgi:hypothetical protein